MKKVILFSLCCLILAACSKKSDSTATEYSNSLTFGTGISQENAFLLTGTGTTFANSTSIYFKLVSKDDNGGSPVRIIISEGNGTLYNTIDYANPQSYGHILISSFSIADAGTYTVSGILVTGNKFIASSPLTIQ